MSRPPVARSAALIIADSFAWFAAIGLTTLARFDFHPARIEVAGLTRAAIVVAAVQIVWGFASGLYRGRWRIGSFHEAGTIAAGASLIGAGMFLSLLNTSGLRPVPLSISIAGPAVFVLIVFGGRFVVRHVRDTRLISGHNRGTRALFFGAGEAGHDTARALLRDPESQILPVAFLDDDPSTRRLRIHGCPVVGGRESMGTAAAQFDADTIVIAIPSASRAQVASIAKEAREAGLRVLVLPRLALILESEVLTAQIRDLRLADYLGRDPVVLDELGMTSQIEGRRVLITGAGGSIGSELAVAVGRFNPAEVLLLDHSERALHALQFRLEGRALLESENLMVADIREADRMDEIFQHTRPDIVFHAAALKHVTFLERFPREAVKTNVVGTLNVLEASRQAGVERFINVSTDKAADPINVLGMTKRIAEMLTSGHGSKGGMTTISVRFGNVLRSSASVVPTFRRQILDDGPVTVTHPDVTRFFMTIEEAVGLVIQAGTIGRSGEVMVLDMGEPVVIAEIARELIVEMSPDKDIEIEYTGLRPGEKLHEVLAGEGEQMLREPHEGITSYAVPPLHVSVVAKLADTAAEDLLESLERVVSRVRTKSVT